MTVSNAAYLKQVFDTVQALGDKAVSSDYIFVIEGQEKLQVLCKQFPKPALGIQGEIEVPGPMGTVTGQPQQVKTFNQGQIMFSETLAGHIEDFQLWLVNNGGYFNGRIYAGDPATATRSARVKKCFIQWDNPDLNFEDRAQVVNCGGTLFYHYHGES